MFKKIIIVVFVSVALFFRISNTFAVEIEIIEVGDDEVEEIEEEMVEFIKGADKKTEVKKAGDEKTEVKKTGEGKAENTSSEGVKPSTPDKTNKLNTENQNASSRIIPILPNVGGLL